MGFNLLAYPQFVYISATTPTDLTEGRLWYNTTLNEWYSSDGVSYSVIVENAENLNYLIMENSINILELQAEASLTGGQSAYMLRDIYSDSGGFLNSVDIGNTTATFSTDKYTNVPTETETTGGATGAGEDLATTHTLVLTALENGIINYVGDRRTNGASTWTIDIKQNGVTLATKNTSGTDTNVNTTFVLSDYSDLIRTDIDSGLFQIVFTRTSGTGTIQWANSDVTYSNANYSMTTQRPPRSNDITTPTIKYKAITFTTTIVQTSAATISSGISKFQIFTFNESVTGAGSITYDISFDNGAHYQTGITAGEETAITNTGTQLIIKQNLILSEMGTAEADGYAVMFW